MKQYESVFFRHREMNSSEYLEVDGCGLTESAGPVIVCSIEELKEAYNAGGADRCAMSEGNHSHSFDNFLKTKGIL